MNEANERERNRGRTVQLQLHCVPDEIPEGILGEIAHAQDQPAPHLRAVRVAKGVLRPREVAGAARGAEDQVRPARVDQEEGVLGEGQVGAGVAEDELPEPGGRLEGVGLDRAELRVGGEVHRPRPVGPWHVPGHPGDGRVHQSQGLHRGQPLHLVPWEGAGEVKLFALKVSSKKKVTRHLLEPPAIPDAKLNDKGGGGSEEVGLDDLEVGVGGQVDGAGLGIRTEAVGGQPCDGRIPDDDRVIGSVLTQG